MSADTLWRHRPGSPILRKRQVRARLQHERLVTSALDERGTERRCIESPNDSKSEGVGRYFDRTDWRHPSRLGVFIDT